MPDAQRAKRIQRVLDECLRRRTAGEDLPDESVISEHPDLMPELEERLAALHLIEQAGRRAEGFPDSSSSEAPSSSDAALPADHIEGCCPHCGAHWRVRAKFAGRQARCRKCGEIFRAGNSSDAVAVGQQAAEQGPGGGAPPESIPGYEIESELGHGGMGCVYEARELATRRTVALKVMLAGRHADERQRRRFEREVEIAAALEHPHIARLYASGLHEGHHWFAMEYVEGVPLDTYVEREHPALTDLLALFARICHAVNHAHQRGVMHRDLKPGNILVDEQAQPRVLDFGLAKLTDRLGRVEESISMPGEVAGTPAYMSPEQTKGDPTQIDIRSDVYSLGVVFYRLLTGQSPYGEQKGLGSLLKAIGEVEPESPRRLRRDIPGEVDAIVMKALRKDAGERYQTAGELARDIEAYLAGDVVQAKRGSGWYALRKLANRYKGVAAVVAVVVVLSLGLGVTMSALFAKKVTEYRDVVREVEVLRERQVARDPVADEEAVRRTIEEYINCWRVEDPTPLERFEQLLADDIVSLYHVGATAYGKDGMVEWYQNSRPGEMTPYEAGTWFINYDVESVRFVGDGAAVLGKASWGGWSRRLNKAIQVQHWQAFVLRRDPSGWRIVLELQSTHDYRLRNAVAFSKLKYGRPLFVDAGADGLNDGRDWVNAYTDLQDALDIAIAGHEIWVAAGTYKPAEPGGDRASSFQLKSGVALYGGFAGNERKRDEGDPKANETILSGDLNGDDGQDFANNNENSYHVVVGSSCDQTSVLDGFTITGGNADGGQPHERGAGMYNHGGSPRVARCTFRANQADGQPEDWSGGAAICNVAHSSPSLIDCDFVGNRCGKDAGGVFNRWHSSPLLVNCDFIDNYAGGEAGAMTNWDDCSPTLVSCRFLGNTAKVRGGALRNVGRCAPTFVNCVISGNIAEDDSGGAMHNHDASPQLVNCTLTGNSAASAGGIIIVGQCRVSLDNCILWGNADRDKSHEIDWLHADRVFSRNSCIRGWTEQRGGSGNIGDDPLFVDADGADDVLGTADDDLRLRSGSPCIDRIDPTALPADTWDLDGDGDTGEPIPLDLAGNPRIVNDAVDIGAYELTGDESTDRWGILAPDGRMVYPPPPNPADPVNYIAWANEEMPKGLTENAADDLLQMHAVMMRNGLSGRAPEALNDAALDGPWTGNPELSQWLERFQPVLGEFRKAARKSQCFYPWWTEFPKWYSGFAIDEPREADPLDSDPRMKDWCARVLLPGLALARGCTKALIAEGWQAWARGNHDLLPGNALVALRCAHHHEHQLWLISKLVGSAMSFLAYDALLGALAESDDPATLAERFVEDLSAADPVPPSLSNHFRGEQVFGQWDACQRFWMPGSEPGSWEVYRPMLERLGIMTGQAHDAENLPEELVLTTEELAVLTRIGFERTLCEIDEHSDAMVAWCETPYYEAPERGREINREASESTNPLIRLIVPSLVDARVLSERRITERRATHLIYRLFAHRAKTGRFPTALRYLDAPDLDELRVDPFSGSDFVYKLTRDTFTLYSVADNLRDDGGRHDPKWKNGDFVFWPVQE